MSRVGKNPVALPSGVDANVNGQEVKVKGPKGELSLVVHDDVTVTKDENGIVLKQRVDSMRARKLWPTMRQLVNNMVVGVTQGYSKELEIQGVGLRAAMQGNTLVMQLGYSHEIRFDIPQGVKIEVPQPTEIKVSGIDKQLVGYVAAKIRDYKRPEPYKGKGIRYKGEYVQRKEGKKK
jgi:large subunit ribosomal protein L6